MSRGCIEVTEQHKRPRQPLLDLRPQRPIAPGLGKRPPEALSRETGAGDVVAHPRQPGERPRTQMPRRRRGDQPLEQLTRGPAVARLKVIPGRLQRSLFQREEDWPASAFQR